MNTSRGDIIFKYYRADIHIHSCLSPCGDWRMGPKDIAEKSREAGLDIIAVCDHNSAENAGAVMRAGANAGLTVLPGMEICSKEEVHVLALFETLSQALQMQQFVYAGLPGKNQPDVWGMQVVANESNEVLGENDRLLIGATALDLYAIVDQIHMLDGLCIASHVDRPAFSVIGNLGFIPGDLAFDALEVSWRVPLNQAGQHVPGIDGFPCVTSSDAHFLEDIGRAWTRFFLAGPGVDEIRMALSGKNNRSIGEA